MQSACRISECPREQYNIHIEIIPFDSILHSKGIIDLNNQGLSSTDRAPSVDAIRGLVQVSRTILVRDSHNG